MNARATLPCQSPGCTRDASHRVRLTADRVGLFAVCRACLTDLQTSESGVRVEVLPATVGPVHAVPPREPVEGEAGRPTGYTTRPIPNEYGLPRTAMVLARRWAARPREVHTIQSAADMAGVSLSTAGKGLRAMHAAGLVSRRDIYNPHGTPHPAYTLTPQGRTLARRAAAMEIE